MELTQPLDERVQLWSIIEVMGACVEQIHHQLSSGEPPGRSRLAKELYHAICHTHNLIYDFFELRYQGLIRRILVTDSAFDGYFRGNSVLDREKLVTNRQANQTPEVLTKKDLETGPLMWACVEMCNACAIFSGSGHCTRTSGRCSCLRSQEGGYGPFQELSSRGYYDRLILSSVGNAPSGSIPTSISADDTSWAQQDIRGFSARHCAIIKQRRDAGKAPHFKPEAAGGVINYTQFARAGQLLRKFHAVKLPSGRKRTAPWLERAREAKLALDAFWEELRKFRIGQLLAQQEKDSHQEAQNCMEIKLLEYYKDPGFLNSVQAALDSMNEEKKAQETLSPAKRPSDDTYELQTQFGTSPKSQPKRLKTEEPKKPPKKKLDPNYEGPPREQPEPVPLVGVDPGIPVTIYVSSASLETFAQLWPTQGKVDQEGFLRWKEFQAAMEDARFRASTTGRSMISFWGTHGTIVFHTPHGSGNVQVKNSLLKTFGRRLTRHFGWTYDTFRDREEVDDEEEEEEDDEDAG